MPSSEIEIKHYKLSFKIVIIIEDSKVYFMAFYNN